MVLVNEKLINEKLNSNKKKKMKGDIPQQVYDPRTKLNVISDNPALIIAEIMTSKNFVQKNENFWKNIAILADYCDQRI